MKTAEEIIEKLENIKGSFWQWGFAIISLYMLRYILDFFLENTSAKIIFIYDVLEYFFWYLALFFAITLLLHFITKEDIKNVFKAAFVFWLLIPLVPIIDFVFSGGSGYRLAYITARYFWFEFFSFFGLFGSYHITYGQTIVLMLGLGLIVIYTFAKTRKISNAIVASLGYYIIGYFYGALPCFLPSPLYFSLLSLVFFESLIFLFLAQGTLRGLFKINK